MIGNVDGIDNDYLVGWAFDPDDPDRLVEVDVSYNGRVISRAMAGFQRPDLAIAGIGTGAHGFYVAMPALDVPEAAVVSASFSETGEPIGAPRSLNRQPQCSRAGVLAADMRRLQRLPLHAFQGMDFDGQKLLLSGFHLPPDGDPFGLTVHSTPGTEFSFEYPIPSPGVADWYWYWPNSQWSAFTLEIDLQGSVNQADEFDFWFETPDDDPDRTALRRNHVYVPKDLGTYQNFPRNSDQLTRVQDFDTSRSVAIGGYNDYRRMACVAESFGVHLPTANVLDWGCGHGRVIRHFASHGKVGKATGVDIDRENVAWVRDNLPMVDASVVPLLPPSELPSGHFDFVYGISVMTHLSRDVQESWLRELKRVAKPGGLVVLTFAGPSSVAFASRAIEPEWLQAWTSSGFDDSMGSDDLVGKIDEPEYYRNTKQTSEVTEAMWGRYFTVLGLYPAVFGYQDVAVLRA